MAGLWPGNGMVCVNQPLTRQGTSMVCVNQPLYSYFGSQVPINILEKRGPSIFCAVGLSETSVTA
jgi:hypothetical protein